MIKKIVIIDFREEGFEIEKKAFSQENVELIIHKNPFLNEDEQIEKIRDAYVIIFTFSKISKRTIDQLTNCKMIIRYGVGLENVDVNAATEKGIYVCNTPQYGTNAVAEHAFTLLMCVNRKLKLMDYNVRNYLWAMENIQPVYSLKNKVLGIVGFGNIGRRVCEIASAFEMKIIIYDPLVDEEMVGKYNIQKVTLDYLVKNSDHITLHAPLTVETRHLFNANIFKKMKSTSTIINTSRGGLINQNDLIQALRAEEIAGAGLDVFEKEPINPDDELLKMNNVVLTPHVGWYTEESIVNLHHEVIDEVNRVLHGNIPENNVNKIKN